MRLQLPVLLIVAILANCLTVQQVIAADKVSTSESEEFSRLRQQLRKLVQTYYPKAKFTSSAQRLDFEFDVQEQKVSYAPVAQMIPARGGILGSVELIPGPYTQTATLPRRLDHCVCKVLEMAPYSQDHNCHLYARLVYPDNASLQFIDRFSGIVDKFDALLPTGFKASVTTPQLPVTPAQPAEPVSSAVASSRPAASAPTAPTPAQSAASVPTAPAPSQSAASDPTAPAPSQSTASVPTAPAPSQSAASVPTAPAPSQSTVSVSTPPTPTQPVTLAQTAASPTVASVSTPDTRKLFFWKATKGADTVYLLGTIHVGTSGLYPMPLEIEKAFDDSQNLVVEVNIQDEKLDPSKLKKIVDATYTAPDKLSKHLSPKTKALFDSYLNWSGETWSMYEEYKPWMVANLINRVPRRPTPGVRRSLGIDNYFLSRAKFAGKNISDLETVEFQLKMDASLPEEVHDQMLQSALINFKEDKTFVKDFFTAWWQGNPDKMLVATSRQRQEDQFPKLEPYWKGLLDNRNNTMAVTLEQMLKPKKGPHFVAVGSAHMGGPTGLIEQLRRRGFNIEQAQTSIRPPEAKPLVLEQQSFYQDRFKIFFPGKVEHERPSAHTSTYDVKEGKDGIYSVMCVELPVEEENMARPPAIVMEKVLTECVNKKLHGRVLSRKSQMLNGYPGRSLEFVPESATSKSMVDGDFAFQGDSRARIDSFIANKRVYMLLAAGKPQFLKSPKVKEFFDSFELIGTYGGAALADSTLLDSGTEASTTSSDGVSEQKQSDSSKANLDKAPDFGVKRLTKFSYPEGRFRISLPSQPAMRYSNQAGLRCVDYLLPDVHGSYNISYLILPGELPPSRMNKLFDSLGESLCKSLKAAPSDVTQLSQQIQGFPGRVLDARKINGKPDQAAKFEFFVARRYVYIVGVAGKKSFVNAPAIDQFFRSLVVTPVPTYEEQVAARQRDADRARYMESFEKRTRDQARTQRSRSNSGRTNSYR